MFFKADVALADCLPSFTPKSSNFRASPFPGRGRRISLSLLTRISLTKISKQHTPSAWCLNSCFIVLLSDLWTTCLPFSSSQWALRLISGIGTNPPATFCLPTCLASLIPLSQAWIHLLFHSVIVNLWQWQPWYVQLSLWLMWNGLILVPFETVLVFMCWPVSAGTSVYSVIRWDVEISNGAWGQQTNLLLTFLMHALWLPFYNC